MRVADFVGKEAIHKDYGRVFVDSAPKGSKAKVNITVIQRGKGWNDITQEYERYQLPTIWNGDGTRNLRWKYTNKDEYGVKDQVHIKELQLP